MSATLQSVLSGVLVLGALTGFLGVFPFLKQQSLLADALSHAMLPGIAAAFLISGGKHGSLLLVGAVIAGLVTSWLFMMLERHTRLKRDALLGILLSSFFGLGILLVSLVQKKGYTHSAVIQRLFFGNASTIVYEDIWVISLSGFTMMMVVIFLWKEMQLILFDSLYARSLGYSVRWIERLFTLFFVIALALGLPLVGVILMSSFLIAPVAAARQWVTSAVSLCILSSAMGAVAGFCGVIVSHYYHLPTGPTIVIILTVVVFFSLLFSPSRGIVRSWFL